MRAWLGMGTLAIVQLVLLLAITTGTIVLPLPGATPSDELDAALRVDAALAVAEVAEVTEAPTAPDDRFSAALAADWLATSDEVPVFGGPEKAAPVISVVPPGARLERTGELVGKRLPVRAPGDGKTYVAFAGWIDIEQLEPTPALGKRQLPVSYPDNVPMESARKVFAPYQSQLDGSPYAGSNCGPTALSMALGALGIAATPGQLRPAVLRAQGLWGDEVGTLITALASVAEARGARIVGLRDGRAIRHWSLDDLRAQLEQGRPTIVQVRYRALPGHERDAYTGDHYVVLTAALAGAFLYNDPITRDGPGWDRIISAERLAEAMNATDRRYAHAAFALASESDDEENVPS